MAAYPNIGRKANNYRMLIRLLVGLAAGLFIVVSVFQHAQSAVSLVYFSATGGNGQVTLRWQTATELDTAGFFINRSNQEQGPYQRLNSSIIPAQGDSISGADYEYLDVQVTNGVTYWYRLESITFSQQSEYYDPVSVVPGVAPTATGQSGSQPTSTPSPTGDPSQNQDGTSISPSTRSTAGATQPASPGEAYPAPGSESNSSLGDPYPDPGASLQSDPAFLGNLSGKQPTATLIPLPTITVLFPTSELSPKYLGEMRQPPENLSDTEGGDPRSELRLFWLVGLVGIWIVVGVWYFIIHRRLEQD